MHPGTLTTVRRVRHAIAQAQSVSELKDIRDKSEALRHYAKQSRQSVHIINELVELKLWAERKAGELLATMQRVRPDDNLKHGPKLPGVTSGPTLHDLGITKIQSFRWQLMGALPEPLFSQHIADVTSRGHELTTLAVLELAKSYRRRHTADDLPPQTSEPLVTTYRGDNADLMARVATFYFRDGDRIADVTYGQGVFWKYVDLTRYDFHPSDVMTCPDASYDFRNLPYPDASFHHVILDPPYTHDPGDLLVDRRYGNADTTHGYSYPHLLHLYQQGMQEACRILRPGGFLFVKCKDQIVSSHQQRTHIHLHDIAVHRLALTDHALFIMVQAACPSVQVRA